MPSTEAINADPKLRADLIDAVRVELAQRDKFKLVAGDAEIEPLLSQEQMGTDLGGHFTSWLKFRRERLNGGGSKAGSHGFGFRLTFSEDVTGPITLGYGCHFGLGVFSPVRSE
jgi:hypothetical protein